MRRAKSFPIGGVAGYSVRATGFAPERHGMQLTYTRVEIIGEAGYVAFAETLGEAEPRVSVPGLSGEDRDYIQALLRQVWQKRALGSVAQ